MMPKQGTRKSFGRGLSVPNLLISLGRVSNAWEYPGKENYGNPDVPVVCPGVRVVRHTDSKASETEMSVAVGSDNNGNDTGGGGGGRGSCECKVIEVGALYQHYNDVVRYTVI